MIKKKITLQDVFNSEGRLTKSITTTDVFLFGALVFSANRIILATYGGAKTQQNNVECEICKHKWNALYPDECEMLECPNCKQMTEV